MAWIIYKYNLWGERQAQDRRNRKAFVELYGSNQIGEHLDKGKARRCQSFFQNFPVFKEACQILFTELHIAFLWTGLGAPYKDVELKLLSNICELQVMTSKGRLLRMVDVNIMEKVVVYFTTDKQRNIMWIKIPKGYDLVHSMLYPIMITNVRHAIYGIIYNVIRNEIYVM